MNGLCKIDTTLLKADLEKFAETYCLTVQEMAVEEANTLAKMAMENYYEAYEPYYYHRTNQMKNNSFQPYKEKVGNEYRGGIKINPIFTNHFTENISESDIYNYVWEEGIHGFETFKKESRGGAIPIYGKGEPKNRYEEIDKKLHSRKMKKKLNERGMTIAKQGSYTMLHF